MDMQTGNGSEHRLFQMAVVIKGIDGVLEFIGGVLLLFVSPNALSRLVVRVPEILTHFVPEILPTPA